jgi:2-methylcitrate dehydratase PrpD
MIELTRILAAYLVNSRPGDLPEAVATEAIRATINWLGCACSGSREETVAAAWRALSPFAGPAQATVLGRGQRTDAPTAALLNGLANCVHSFNDTHPATMAHPTGPVAAALFAQAELKTVSGADFLHALILGMEVECRLANMIAAPPASCSTGISTLGVTAPFGAAAAVGKVIGLDERQMVWALGLAATMASGLRSTHGSMASLLIPGHGARCGFTAAHLAAAGFTAADRSLESPNGFAVVFSDSADIAGAVERLGEHYEMMSNRYKPYPCGVVCHPAIDACLEIAGQAGFDPAAIESVTLDVHPLAVKLADRPAPRSGMEALVSLQHWAAAALLRGRAGLEEGSDRCVADARVAALRQRVHVSADDRQTGESARVSVRLADGAVIGAHVAQCRGSAGRPMSDADLEGKFRSQARLVASDDRVEDALQLLWSMRTAQDASVPLRFFS